MKTKKTWVLAAVLAAALVLLGGLLALLERGDRRTQQTESPALERTADGAIILPNTEPTTAPEDAAETAEAAPSATLPPARTADGDSGALPTPGVEPDVPERETRLSAAYFADAAFVGDETVMALERYDYDGLLTEAAFYEVGSVTNTDYVNRMKQDGVYGKVYIGLGGAELAYKRDTVRDSLRSAIDSLRAAYPDCLIYLMSVSPVSKYRTDVSQAIRMDRLPDYNEMLRGVAIDKQVWYIEITSALVDEDGYLPSDVTEDGINYTPGHYQGWYDRIATRYIGEPE